MSPRLWLLVILALAGAFAPSRADARGAETCAQGFLDTATNARPESEPQVAGTHQGFAACGYESASGYSQAASASAVDATAQGATALPQYVVDSFSNGNYSPWVAGPDTILIRAEDGQGKGNFFGTVAPANSMELK